MRDFGLVSIITPNYNCEKYIRETIESVQAQTYTNWEMLVIDDCSTDSSLKILKELKQNILFLQKKKLWKLQIIISLI